MSRARWANWFSDGGRTLAGATLALLLVALIEAHWVSARQDTPWIGGALVCAGLLSPLVAFLGCALSAGGWLLHDGALRASLISDWLAPVDLRLRARRVAYLLVAPSLAVVWLLSTAVVALGCLASPEAAASSGAVLGLSCGLSVLFSLALGSSAASALAERWQLRAPSALRAAGLGLALALTLLLGGVLLGSTSGEGGGLRLLGVLKRPELDLRPVALLTTLLLGGYGLPLALTRLPGIALGLASVVGLGVLGGYAAHSDFEMVAIEREAPLSRAALGALKRLTDSDKDGFSAYFGDQDCAPADPARNPGAEEIPGNGVDEDCSGADDVVAVQAPAPPKTESPSYKALLASKLPKDLNVVLITVDTLRADLGFAGYARPVSPNLDALARRSTVFENAYALASYTAKSVGPLLIGKYSSETHRDYTHFNNFGQGDTFVQQRLQKRGIRTISVQAFWYLFAPGSGYERGFDVLDSTAAPKTIRDKGDRSVTGDKVTDRAIAQLADPANTRGQFFLWAHYVDPHADYVTHADFDFGKSDRDEYDSEVAFVDQQIGRLLAHLEKSAFAARTAIIVSSDHGEAFGEHGMIRHGFELWEELVRVPLLVFVPGAEPGRVPGRRSAVGLAPTLLELQGLEAPAGSGADFMSGESLLPDVFGSADRKQSAPIFIDMAAGPHNAERQAFIDGDFKLVVSGGRPLSLFNLQSDPEEKRDLIRDKASVAPVFASYKAFKQRLKPVYVRPR